MSEKKDEWNYYTYGPRSIFFRTDGRLVHLDEPSKYSDHYLSTMQDIVTILVAIPAAHLAAMQGLVDVLSGVPATLVGTLDAEVNARVEADPWAHRNQYGIWSEWDW